MARSSSRVRTLITAATTEWRELGWIGRLALVGVLLSVVIAVTLGFTIPASAERHVLEAQTDIIESVAIDLGRRGLVPVALDDPTGYEAFDEEVRLRLLGGETVRVKVWLPDGTIAYSDAAELIGRRFELTEPALRALDGEPSHHVSDLSEPAHALETDLGELIEFYIPMTDTEGNIVGLFEVEQQVDGLDTTLGHIRRNVWLSIGTGLGVLTVFLASLAIAGARAINRRRKQAEDLFGDLLRAQEAEQKRIVGALHDDVGQPLYRLLYGLEKTRSHVDDAQGVDQELGQMEDIVRDIDTTLRAELKLLHHGEVEDLGLDAALGQLVETTEAETDLTVSLSSDLDGQPGLVASTALFRAAQEGLVNARKHAQAGAVSIRLFESGQFAYLEVEDDGLGVRGREGLGLATTRERLDAIGGGLRVSRRPKGGTRLRAWVPMESAE